MDKIFFIVLWSGKILSAPERAYFTHQNIFTFSHILAYNLKNHIKTYLKFTVNTIYDWSILSGIFEFFHHYIFSKQGNNVKKNFNEQDI